MAKGSRGQYDDETLTKTIDELDKRINKKPDSFYTEGSLVTVTFNGLDQTVPHKLSGKHEGILPMLPKATAAVTIYEDTPASNLVNTHIRLIASAACTLKVWVWR